MQPLTPDQHRALMQALLPSGAAWTRELDAILTKLLLALSDEPARVDDRNARLIEESDPRTAFELLAEWERLVGLPDECSELSSTLAERRAAVVAKLTSLDGQTPAYFIKLAARLGYEVGIYEYRSCRAGLARAGDHCGGDDWGHAFRVDGPEVTVSPFRAGQNQAGDRLRTWGNERLECTIEAQKPAHTTVLFAYETE